MKTMKTVVAVAFTLALTAVQTASAKTVEIASGGDIAAAITEATSDDTPAEVVLGVGDYAPKATISIFSAVTVRGATGNPADVVLKSGANIQLVMLKAKGCAIYDLTMDALNTSGPNGSEARLLASSVDCVVSNCVFRNVKRSAYGSNGAVRLSAAGALITHCVLTNNHVVSSAYANVYGGLMLDKGATAANCLIANNAVDTAAKDGAVGGVYMANGNLVNCTIVNNTGLHCGGVKCDGGSVVNCVIAGNKSTAKGTDYDNIWKDTDSRFTNCAADGSGIQGTDCQYNADKGSFFGNYDAGDYSPASGSALTDHGKALDNPPAKDLAGLDRVMGQGIDIGAYETDPSKLGVKVNVSAQQGFVPATIAFSAETSGVEDGDVVSYSWTFGDGGSDTTTVPSASHQYATAGDYTAMVTLTRGSEQVSSKVDLHFVPKVMYVKGKNAAAAFPYDSEGNAAATINDVLAVAIPENDIVLYPGTITEKATVYVKSKVTIRSSTGNPADVIVKPSSGFFLMDVSASGAVVAGLTLEGGGNIFGGNGDGLLIALNSFGTATNCIFRNVTGTGYGTHGAVYVSGADALVTHCVISNVSLSGSHAANYAGACLTAGAKMSNCLIVDNHYTSATDDSVAGVRINDGRLVNCTVVGNVGKLCGGVRCVAGSVVNCAIFGNAAEDGGNDYANIWKGDDARFDHCASDIKAIGGTECQFADDKSAVFSGYAARDFTPAAGAVLRENGKELADAPALDLAGNPRLSGDKIDIGAYEADRSTLAVKLNLSPSQAFAPAEIVLTAEADGVEGAACTYEWTFGDGETAETSVPTVTHLYEVASNYTASVKLVKGTDEVEDDEVLHLVPRIMCVKGGNANAAFPYDTVDNAASNLNQALAVAIPRSVIEVEPGTVREKGAVRLSEQITVRGRTGNPADVVVIGGGNSGDVTKEVADFDLANTGAWMESLTLLSPSSHRIVRIDVAGGTLTNCVVTGPGYETAILNKSKDGVVTHCVVSNIYLAGVSGGGAVNKGIYVATTKGRLSNTLVTGCSVVGVSGSAVVCSGGPVDNCTVVENDLRGTGGWDLKLLSGDTCQASVRDTIFAANTEKGEPALNIQLSGRTALRCVGDFATDGIATVASAEAIFRNPAKGDWRLKGNSPARDVVPKAELPVNLPVTDLGGNPRVYSVGLDAGCYECQSGGMMMLVR